MLKSGDHTVNWSSFKPCSDIKKVVWVENEKITEIGFTTEEVNIDEEQDLLYRKQELTFNDPNKGKRTINLVLNRFTFEPVSCTDEGPFNVNVTYQDKEIDVNSTKYKRTDGVFDLFSIELLLRLLPLELGYTNELQAFNHMESQTVVAKIEVTQKEKISDGNQDVDAWCVQLFFGDKLQTYWISCETNEILKQSVKIRDGVFFDFVR